MKKKDPHLSSASDYDSRSNVQYRNEKEVSTFIAHTSIDSTSLPYPHTTIKIDRSAAAKASHSAKFKINISKMSREESNFRLNQKLSGKKITSVSSGNE